jgi:anti-sigma regulatory factor (Ser/Thr protein kinase)
MLFSETFPKSPRAAAQARLLLERIRPEVSEAALEDARLLVSELVSNAVEHAPEPGDIEVRVQILGGTLRIEVLDPGPGFTPPPFHADARKESGWGLLFTELLAERWAADTEGRTRVWFEVDRLKAR